MADDHQTLLTSKQEAEAFALHDASDPAADAARHIHVRKGGFRCATEKRGQDTPNGASLYELVVNASEGFIPLWAKGVVLRWKFADGTLKQFQNPAAAEQAIERLLGEAVVEWGAAAPIAFRKTSDVWDFEIVVKGADDCDPNGCVLASAFFPDAGRHRLSLYPILFRQSRAEQIETLAHEIGHIFGLRHFFALKLEQGFPAEIFGEHAKFTIMNYGDESILTDTDRSDLANLYRLAWSGQLAAINGTPIRLVRPYHDLPATDGAFAIAAARA
jgi:reprolysin-like metallo-peptidase family M12B